MRLDFSLRKVKTQKVSERKQETFVDVYILSYQNFLAPKELTTYHNFEAKIQIFLLSSTFVFDTFRDILSDCIMIKNLYIVRKMSITCLKERYLRLSSVPPQYLTLSAFLTIFMH